MHVRIACIDSIPTYTKDACLQVLLALAGAIHKAQEDAGLQNTLKAFDVHSLLLDENVRKPSNSQVEASTEEWHMSAPYASAVQQIIKDVASFTDAPLLHDLLQLHAAKAVKSSVWVALVETSMLSPRTMQLWLDSPSAAQVRALVESHLVHWSRL